MAKSVPYILTTLQNGQYWLSTQWLVHRTDAFLFFFYNFTSPCVATGEKHQMVIESDDITLHIYLYLSFL